MPELPEVEIARRNLVRWTKDASVVNAEVVDAKVIDDDATQFENSQFNTWERRGKYLVGAMSCGRSLISHLGMTGKWVADPPQDRKHQRLRFTMSNGRTVSFVDPRRFGQCWLTHDAVNHPRVAKLGPDALDDDVSAKVLKNRVGTSKAPLKQRLLDQAVVAGLGNIAVIEMAWRAQIHPHTRCHTMTVPQWQAITDAMHAHIASVLQAEDGPEIAYLGETGAQNPFACYGRSKEPCRRCKTSIIRTVLSGRPSFFCPECQPEPLAR